MQNCKKITKLQYLFNTFLKHTYRFLHTFYKMIILQSYKNLCFAGVRHARRGNHNYFFSWEHPRTRNLEVDWLDARNICRRHCMDLVSMETPDENNFIKQRLANARIRYIWTSGRKCNFEGCNRRDQQPNLINGWFWSGSGVKIGPTNNRANGDWSHSGGAGRAQPDNREIGQVQYLHIT